MRHKKLEKWEKHEEHLLKTNRGEKVIGSGSCTGLKGDVRIDEGERFLIECKQTESSGFRVTQKLWWKIRSEAIKDKRVPAISLDIKNTKLMVVDSEYFWDLVKESKQEK